MSLRVLGRQQPHFDELPFGVIDPQINVKFKSGCHTPFNSVICPDDIVPLHLVHGSTCAYYHAHDDSTDVCCDTGHLGSFPVY